ncbi:hypothetical protein [Legionella nautarum]|uniref:hypothetical protein n=1 Tax=Legionella nautarum TaxID=45070 RepID=UPI000A8B311F|nr:hypothetical protein [Legionella nautarum]
MLQSEKTILKDISTENLVVQTLPHWVNQIKLTITPLKANEDEEPEPIEDKKMMGG